MPARSAVFDCLPGWPKTFRDFLVAEARFAGVFCRLTAMAPEFPFRPCSARWKRSLVRLARSPRDSSRASSPPAGWPARGCAFARRSDNRAKERRSIRSGTQEGMLSSFAGPTILLWGSNTRTMQNGSRSNWVRGCEGSRWNYIQRKQD